MGQLKPAPLHRYYPALRFLIRQKPDSVLLADDLYINYIPKEPCGNNQYIWCGSGLNLFHANQEISASSHHIGWSFNWTPTMPTSRPARLVPRTNVMITVVRTRPKFSPYRIVSHCTTRSRADCKNAASRKVFCKFCPQGPLESCIRHPRIYSK